MKMKKISKNYYTIYFIIFAILITIGILFIKPEVGIADQADFDRIMTLSGLSLLDPDINNPNFIIFYNYIVTDYSISHIDDISKTIVGSSLGYLIILISSICKLLGETTFKTQY